MYLSDFVRALQLHTFYIHAYTHAHATPEPTDGHTHTYTHQPRVFHAASRAASDVVHAAVFSDAVSDCRRSRTEDA